MIAKLEEKLNLNFADKDLLRQALVHRSYLNENEDFELDNNERLEFLGDAVLELIVTDYLYREFPDPEGELTNLRASLIKRETLAELGHEWELDKYLYLSKGEAGSTGKAKDIILSNAVEAIMGAIYLDAGLDKSTTLLEKYLFPKLKNIISTNSHIDAKSKLQEIMQEKENETPAYRVLEESGPDHKKKFVVGVEIGDKTLAEGSGPSKQKAEMAAAEAALKKLNL